MNYQRTRLTIFAFSHFVVDMCCFFALYSGAVSSEHAALWVLLYNALAFGLQVPFGALADAIDDARPAAILGIGLVAVGIMLMEHILISILLLGIGNALFHVGGAVTVLRHRPGDALRAGFYVAPGALGVSAGVLSAASGGFSQAVSILVLLICVFLIIAAGPGTARGNPVEETPREPLPLGTGAIMLCLVSIGIRSFSGFSADLPNLILLGGLAAFLGKLMGGIFARLLNWNVLALLGAGIGGLMMAFFPGTRIIYFGVFLFNLAMPLTLSAVMKSFPAHAGLGFGLTTFALLLGWLPLISCETGYCASSCLLAALVLAAALMLFFTLRYGNVKASTTPKAHCHEHAV